MVRPTGYSCAIALMILLQHGAAIAQDDSDAEPAPVSDVDDDEGTGEAGDDSSSDELKDLEMAEGSAAQLGIGLRFRYIFLPESILELFLEDAPSGVSKPGFGLEVTRRKGDFDIVFGLEYSGIAPDDGLYLEKGDTPGIPGENPDLVEYDGFSLLSLDVSFVWHKELAPKFDLRYGAGIGLAAVLGDLIQTDTNCSIMGDLDSCTPVTSEAQGQFKEKNQDVPPVVPVVNVMLGLRVEVAPKLTFNVETGFRDMFYTGLGATYLF